MLARLAAMNRMHLDTGHAFALIRREACQWACWALQACTGRRAVLNMCSQQRAAPHPELHAHPQWCAGWPPTHPQRTEPPTACTAGTPHAAGCRAHSRRTRPSRSLQRGCGEGEAEHSMLGAGSGAYSLLGAGSERRQQARQGCSLGGRSLGAANRRVPFLAASSPAAHIGCWDRQQVGPVSSSAAPHWPSSLPPTFCSGHAAVAIGFAAGHVP